MTTKTTTKFALKELRVAYTIVLFYYHNRVVYKISVSFYGDITDLCVLYGETTQQHHVRNDINCGLSKAWYMIYVVVQRRIGKNK